MKKTVSLFLSFLIFLSSATAYAQKAAGSFLPADFSASSANSLQNLEIHLKKKQLPVWQQGLSLVREDFALTGKVHACHYADVLKDTSRLAQLSAEEMAEAVYYGHFLSTGGERNTQCAEDIKNLIFQFLNTPYDEQSPSFQMYGFMLIAAAALARQPAFQRSIENMAFEKIALAASSSPSASSARWATELIYLLAQDPSESKIPARDFYNRRMFEQRLKMYIARFNRLKDDPTDYYMPGIPCSDVFCISNQGALVSLFAQINNFLAMKNEDPLLKQMVSTGGLNFIGRGERPAFSDKGETFYLHHVTPGTDGRGHLVDSANGHAHFVLHTLILSLFVSYSSRESTAEVSALMENFIDSYLDVDEEGHFASYLYIPLQAMRMGKELGYAFSLNGWDKEEAALQQKLYSILKSGYKDFVFCNYVQGTCEVVAEWVGIGKIFGLVFRGVGAIGKGVSQQIIRVLPAKTLFHLGMAQVITKQAFRWSRQNVKALLSRYGWKVATGAGAAALLTGDEGLRQSVTY